MPYAALVGPFIMAGIGMGLFFAPVANVVLGSVAPHEEGQASGANNAIRELGGVFGVAVLASIFTHYGSYRTPHTFVNGLTPGGLRRRRRSSRSAPSRRCSSSAAGRSRAPRRPGRRARSRPASSPSTPSEASRAIVRGRRRAGPARRARSAID